MGNYSFALVALFLKSDKGESRFLAWLKIRAIRFTAIPALFELLKRVMGAIHSFLPKNKRFARRIKNRIHNPVFFRCLYLNFLVQGLLGLASVSHPIVICLDSFERLFVDEHNNGGAWLPAPLPKYCKVILTFQQEEDNTARYTRLYLGAQGRGERRGKVL